MASNTTPPLSSLTFLSTSSLPSSSSSSSSQSALYTALKKQHLSLTNRLRSIHQDALFVAEVADANPGLAVVGNERAGSWYVHPGLREQRRGEGTGAGKEKGRGSVYFKSTDGHWGVWGLSLRRLNLHLLGIIEEKGGCIIVDSTRRGKSMPDALSKTVPIWVTVMNRVLFPDLQSAHGLRVPRNVVSESEKAQIEGRLEGWVGDLKGLKLDIERLRKTITKPMRVTFVTRENWEIQMDRMPEWHTVICCSASRMERGDNDSYVQGAGDDTENWARGLTADMFWSHHDELLVDHGEPELREMIDQIVSQERSRGAEGIYEVRPTGSPVSFFIAAQDALPEHVLQDEIDATVACCSSIEASLALKGHVNKESPPIMRLGCSTGKLGSKMLREKLPLLKPFFASLLSKYTLPKILFTCSNGLDLSVGVALMFFCMYFNDEGKLVTRPREDIDKGLIRQRLAVITEVVTLARPSRATLQAVNTALIEKPG